MYDVRTMYDVRCDTLCTMSDVRCTMFDTRIVDGITQRTLHFTSHIVRRTLLSHRISYIHLLSFFINSFFMNKKAIRAPSAANPAQIRITFT